MRQKRMKKKKPEKEEKKKEEKKMEEIKKQNSTILTKEEDVPFANMNVSISLYPEEVDSPQDAQDWDDELMEASMLEAERDQKSDDEDSLYSEEEDEESDDVASSPTPVSHLSAQPSSTRLADVLRSKYGSELSTFKLKVEEEKRKKLNFKKMLKLPQRGSKPENEEDDDYAKDDMDYSPDHASSGSDDEEMMYHDAFLDSSSPLSRSPISSPKNLRRSRSLTEENLFFPSSPTFNLKNQVESSSWIFFIDGQQPRRGRRLEECLKDNSAKFPRIFFTKTPADISGILPELISGVSKKTGSDEDEIIHEEISSEISLKIGIGGGDSYVNQFMRNLVEICNKKHRDWKSYSIYLIPTGKKNDLAAHIGSLDATYKSLFCVSEWKELWDRQDEISDDESRDAAKKITRYLEEANATYNFDIGETVLAYPSSTEGPTSQKNIPFIKGVQIGDKDEVENSDLQIDYFFSKKKGEGHKEIKNPGMLIVTRLLGIANALHIENENRPTPTTLSMSVALRKHQKTSMKDAITRLGSKKEKESEGNNITAKTHRVICSTSSDTPFKVMIDGVEFPGVKLASIFPTISTSQMKNFPVQFHANGSMQIPKTNSLSASRN
eukprot:TRINITY_DN5566_c2_g1_i1.p1 TRINITY_DN5566_c2_g1~~TRINITY_DN5566_c2_g1_i1.p1  ORF type:complete len:609 (+),score=268.00 TRINITY_DN5566_c2_g1_i1:529-2355(+)